MYELVRNDGKNKRLGEMKRLFIIAIFSIFALLNIELNASISNGEVKCLLYNCEINGESLFGENGIVCDNIKINIGNNKIVITCDGIFLYILSVDKEPFNIKDQSEAYNCIDLKTGERLKIVYKKKSIQNIPTIFLRINHESSNEYFSGIQTDK